MHLRLTLAYGETKWHKCQTFELHTESASEFVGTALSGSGLAYCESLYIKNAMKFIECGIYSNAVIATEIMVLFYQLQN